MPIALVVTRHFGSHKPGDRITDETSVARVQASENHANVVAVEVRPDTEAAASEKPPTNP